MLAFHEQFAPRTGALTLCMGEETGSNIPQSLIAAEALSRNPDYGPVLYINTIQTQRQLGNTIRAVIDPKFSMLEMDPQLIYYTTPPGLVAGHKDRIEQFIDRLEPKTIVINSLDLSSKDYRRKEELLFAVMEWLEQYEITIVIYSELRKHIPKQGKIERGGVGKFSAIAEEVMVIGENEEIHGNVECRMENEELGNGENENGGADFFSKADSYSGADSQSASQGSREILAGGLRVRPTDHDGTQGSEEIPAGGLRVRPTDHDGNQGSEGMLAGGLRVRPTDL